MHRQNKLQEIHRSRPSPDRTFKIFVRKGGGRVLDRKGQRQEAPWARQMPHSLYFSLSRCFSVSF
ncbi:hypothetical protein EJ110_NYTH52723 [Nymphaea thermarum]|nr:hypothetical protein EJ110_NYTH52723 [Nymphaea thermarum]